MLLREEVLANPEMERISEEMQALWNSKGPLRLAMGVRILPLPVTLERSRNWAEMFGFMMTFPRR